MKCFFKKRSKLENNLLHLGAVQIRFKTIEIDQQSTKWSKHDHAVETDETVQTEPIGAQFE